MNQELKIMNHGRLKAIIPNSLFTIQLRKGFTLVELLIVIAILGILAAAVLTSINVVANITKANLVKAKTFSSSVENALAIAQVGKWSFEEGIDATANDTSGYTNDGTLNGGVTWQTADQCGLGFGGCLSFDGVNDYVNVGNNVNLSTRTAVTAEAWVNLLSISAPQQQVIVSKGAWLTNTWILTTETGTSLFMFRIGPSVANRIDVTTPAKTGWHHVVGTYDGTNGKIYVDGALKNTQTLAGLDANNDASPVLVGMITGGGFYFNGMIDEVKIYNQALLSSQIQQLYAQGLPKHQLAKR